MAGDNTNHNTNGDGDNTMNHDVSSHDVTENTSHGKDSLSDDFTEFSPSDDDSPRWDDSFGDEPEDDSFMGNPDNVADVHGGSDDDNSLPYAHDDFRDTSLLDSYDDDNEHNEEETKKSSLGKILAGVSAGLIIFLLAGWGAAWANWGTPNPVEALNRAKGTTTTTTQKVDNAIGEENPNNSANNGDAQRIKDLESSLTKAMDDVDKAQKDSSTLQESIRKGATHTHTVTSAGQTTTTTRTKTDTKTSQRNVTRTQTTTKPAVTRTITSRAPAPRPEVVTRTNTVRVPGPERTVTKTVPSGRVTVTTTVVERWG